MEKSWKYHGILSVWKSGNPEHKKDIYYMSFILQFDDFSQSDAPSFQSTMRRPHLPGENTSGLFVVMIANLENYEWLLMSTAIVFYGLFTLPNSDSDSNWHLNGYIVLCRTFHIAWSQIQIPIPTTGMGLESKSGSVNVKKPLGFKKFNVWNVLLPRTRLLCHLI